LKPAANISDYLPAVAQNLASISAIARVEFTMVEALPQRDSPVAITDSGKVMLIVEVDRAAERARLTKEADRIESEVGKAKAKLSNASFVDRAPPAVVEQEKKRLVDFETKLADLRDQLAKSA